MKYSKQKTRKLLRESSNAAKVKLTKFLSSLPRDEKQFLRGGSTYNDLRPNGELQLTNDFIASFSWVELFERLGYQAFDLPLEHTIENVRIAVFFQRGTLDAFTSAVARECKRNKELQYGLKYGLLSFDQSEYLVDELSDLGVSGLADALEDPQLEFVVVDACTPSYDSVPFSSLDDAIASQICTKAGIKPLQQKQLDDLVQMAKDVSNEDFANYQENRRFKWDMFFKKLGLEREGTDVIRAIHSKGWLNCTSIQNIPDGYSYETFFEKIQKYGLDSSMASEVKRKSKGYRKCLMINLSTYSNMEELSSREVAQFQNLGKKLDAVLGKFPWFAGTYILRYKKTWFSEEDFTDVCELNAFIFADDFPERYFA